MFWNSEPRTDEKRANAGEAAEDYLEYAKSVMESIPMAEKVVEIVELFKQLVHVRRRRGV